MQSVRWAPKPTPLAAVVLVALGWLAAFAAPAAAITLSPDERSRLPGALEPRTGDGWSVLTLRAPVTAGAFTVISEVMLDEAWTRESTRAIGLAALVDGDSGPNLGLGLIWTEAPTGWFPVWKLQLWEGGALNSAGGSAGGDASHPDPRRTDLATVTPQRGHTYRAVLSFDSLSGVGSVLVIDVTEGRVVFSGDFTASVDPGGLHPSAGAAGPQPGSVKPASVELYSVYLPVASRLELYSAHHPRITVRALARDEEPRARLITSTARLTGEYWVQVDHHDTGGSRRLGPIAASGPETALPLPLAELPGRSTIRWEYVIAGHPWLSDALDVSIGWLGATFHAFEVSAGERAVRSRLSLASDGELASVPLTVKAQLRAVFRSRETGMLAISDYDPVTVFTGRVDLGREGTEVHLITPVPPLPQPGLWRVTYSVEAGSTIDVRVLQREHVFMLPAAEGVEAVSAPEVAASAKAISLEEEARLRREAALRPRRILFNNDGDDVRVLTSERTVAAFLQRRTTPLIGSQVDTIIYDTTAGTFGSFSRWTEVGEIFLTKEGIFGNNLTADLLLQGIDPLQAVIDFAREHGFEIFWAMRMNDTHDAGVAEMLSELKRNHPELLFGSPTNRPPYGAWSGVDYGEPKVRELAYRFVEEVAQHYDVDGIFLDFFRHPVLFKRVAWGELAGPAELDALTELMRRIRGRLREIGAARGKPILLAVRVPDTTAYARAIGIDLERWLAEGLIDWLVPGGYFRLSRWEESVALGRRYGVPVYPSLDESRVALSITPDAPRQSLESYRARAMNVWQAGAAGVHLFNMFTASHPMLREIGSPQTLLGKDKVYFISVRGDSGSANPNRYVPSAENFFQTPVVTPDSPLALWPDSPLTLFIDVGEDLHGAVAAGFRPTLTLRLVIAGVREPEALAAELNGRRLENARIFPTYVEYDVDPSWVRRGTNRIELAMTDRAGTFTRATWAPPAGNQNALRITELTVSALEPRALRLQLKAKAAGEARVGSVIVRAHGEPGNVPVPPGFEVEYGGYLHPRGWTAPGFRVNGPFDEDEDEDGFTITLPMEGGEPGEYALALYVTNRPAPGTYYDDRRLIHFRIDGEGRVLLPFELHDVQLFVRYTR